MKISSNMMTLSIALCFFLTPAAFGAGVPHLMNIQGILTDDDGNPVPDDVHMVDFSIYDVESAGVALWTESRPVATINGLFNMVLGEANPIPASLFSGADLWLGMALSGSSEMAPRQRLTAVPYVYRALNADSAGFAFTVADDAINSSKIANGSLLLGDLGQNGATSGQVIKWNGSAWSPANDETGSGGGGGWVDDGTVVRLSSSSDKVGIGVTDPQEKLHVAGDIRLNAGNDIAFANDNTRVYETGGDLVITADDDIHLQPDDDVYLRRDGGSTWIHFDNSSERLGIGLTDPLSRLHIQGGPLGLPASALHSDVMAVEASDAIFGLYSSDAGSAGSQMSFGEISGGVLVDKWALIRETTGNSNGGLRMTFGTNSDTWQNSTVAYFGKNGKVGIGITNPAYKFTVQGEISIASGGVSKYHINYYNGGLNFAETGVSDRRIHISDGGNVGIGTATPGAKLGVNGTAKINNDLQVNGAFKGDISSSSGTDGAPFPRPAYDSGWLTITQDETIQLTHGIGGDRDNYVVNMEFSASYRGVTNDGLGGYAYYASGDVYYAGVYYSHLTTSTVNVHRNEDDDFTNEIRLRIWVIE